MEEETKLPPLKPTPTKITTIDVTNTTEDTSKTQATQELYEVGSTYNTLVSAGSSFQNNSQHKLVCAKQLRRDAAKETKQSIIVMQTRMDNKLSHMNVTIHALNEVYNLIDNSNQIVMKKIEAMVGNIAQTNMSEETPKLATKTSYMDATTLPSLQTLKDSFRREPTHHHTGSDITYTTPSSRPITTPLPLTQPNTQEEDNIDANDNFKTSPREFDTIM